MRTSEAVLSQGLAWIAERLSPSRRRALVLGPPEPWTSTLRARGFEVQHRDALSEIDLPAASLDLVVAGGLEHAPWDRWALQVAHHALADDGCLLIIAPSFHALASPADLAFLAGRAAREAWHRARRLLGLAPPRERFRGRRYRRSDLAATLEHLGYRVEESATHAAGWLAPLRALLPGLVASKSRTLAMLGRRGPSLFGIDPRRPYPDPGRHREAFERGHRRDLDDRERWLAAHPHLKCAAPVAFDPGVSAGANVLVLCPHPDDELIGCGGTLARLIAHGARVTILHATDGSEAASLWHTTSAARRTVRLDEARRVGELMGFASLIFWKEDNAAFRESEARVRELQALLEQTRPALVFTPFVTDVHPDHRVLSRMLARALRALGSPELEQTRVLSYQVWSLVPPNLYCDVTDVVALQERALLLYTTAMKVDDYVHFCQDRNYYDALAVAGRPGFVESFLATPAGEYPELADSGRSSGA